MSDNTERKEIDYANEWWKSLSTIKRGEYFWDFMQIENKDNCPDEYRDVYDSELVSIYRKEVIEPWIDKMGIHSYAMLTLKHSRRMSKAKENEREKRNFELYFFEVLEKQNPAEQTEKKTVQRIMLKCGGTATVTKPCCAKTLQALNEMAEKVIEMHLKPELILERHINESHNSNVFYAKSSCKEFYEESILKAMEEYATLLANQETQSLLNEVEALRRNMTEKAEENIDKGIKQSDERLKNIYDAKASGLYIGIGLIDNLINNHKTK